MVGDNPLVLLFAGRFEVRGSCAYTLRLLEHLPACGISAEMICSSADQIPLEKREQLPIHEYPPPNIPLLNRLVVARLANDFRPLGPALVHVQTRSLARLGMRLAESLQVPYILTIHDFLDPGKRLPFSPEWGRKIIAVSDAVRRGLAEQANIAHHLIEVIPSGVELPAAMKPPASNASAHVPVIGTAGPLERIKGHLYFLEAARQVVHSGFEVEFVIAGSGREEANLRRLARELGIAERVTFAPYVRDYTDVIEALDIFVLPSWQQGLGTVMIEAMALAKPVIASSVGGVYSVVQNGENGLLIPGRDSAALADAIVYLLEHPAEAVRMGQAARMLVARDFNVELMTRRTAELYSQVI